MTGPLKELSDSLDLRELMDSLERELSDSLDLRELSDPRIMRTEG